jgi:hypothetical protein
MGRGALIRATILLSSLGLFGCAHFGDVAPMTRAECSSAQVCTVRGVVRARQAEGAWMGVMDMEGERCIAISLPPQFADRLRREGPREMTVRGEVWPDPSRDSMIMYLERDGRRIGLGLCGDFYLWTDDYDVQIH